MEIKAHCIRGSGGEGVLSRIEQELDKNVCFILARLVVESVDHGGKEASVCCKNILFIKSVNNTI